MNEITNMIYDEADAVKDTLISALTMLRHNNEGLTDEEKLAKVDDLIDKAVTDLEDNVLALFARL